MVTRASAVIAFVAALPALACNDALGIQDHRRAPDACDGAGSCLFGDIASTSAELVAPEAGPPALADGGAVTLTDDGFEFGETRCAGATCVTGAIVP